VNTGGKGLSRRIFILEGSGKASEGKALQGE